MKGKVFKIIVWINIAIFAVIYACAVIFPGFGGIGGAFFLTLFQVALNFVIAVIVSFLHFATMRVHSTWGEAVRGFWLSIGLVILISYPACLLVGHIRPLGLN